MSAGNRVSITALFDRLAQELQLQWLAGQQGGRRYIDGKTWLGQAETVVPTAAFSDVRSEDPRVSQSSVVWVLGASDLAEMQQRWAGLAGAEVLPPSLRLIVLTEQQSLPNFLSQAVSSAEVPLFVSALPTGQVRARIYQFLSWTLAKRETVHGVFLDVLGLGILLVGESGVGKSELALELLSHGHRLVADDAVEFTRTAANAVVGTCPAAIRDHLEVRGLGIINIREMFGAAAILRSKRLRLAIELRRMSVEEMAHIDRLNGEQGSIVIMGVPVTRLTLPVTPGRNLAVLVEVAARKYFLNESGVNILENFERQLQQHMIKHPE